MFKYLVSAFLIGTQAFAGLPPTTAKSQNGSASVSFQTQAPMNQITKTSSTAALIETGNVNILANPGFEATTGTSDWTASGGSFVTATTFAFVGSGLKSANWDSNAASQTLTSTAVAIPGGDYGKNYEVSADFRCDVGTCTHLLQAFDGTNVIASTTITSDSSRFARTQLNFPAPTSGNISARIVSVASNEPVVYIDDVYVGRARNVGSVAQAELVGTVKITGCNAIFNTTSATFANLSTQTGCSYSVEGNISAPLTNNAAFRLINQPPGKYVFKYNGTVFSDAASTECWFRFSDGTNTTRAESYNTAGSALGTPTIQDSIVLNSPISSTFHIQAKKNGTGTCGVFGTNTYPGVIEVYRYPLSSEIAVRSEQFNGFGSVLYSDSTLRSGGNVTSTTFTTASIASLQTYATYRGNAQACTTNTNFCIRVPNLPAGDWKVTVTGGVIGSNGGTSVCQVGVFDGTSRESWYSSVVTESYGNGTAYFRYDSQGDREFTLQTRRASGSGNCYIAFQNGADSTTNTSALRVTVEPARPSLPAPNLVGSVTSLSTGSLRVESATITNNGSACTTTVSSSSWITGNVRSSGVCTSTIATGVFASTPSCICTVNGAPTSTGYCGIDNTLSSTSVATVTRDSAGSQSNQDRSLLCLGPRGSL